MRCMTSSLSRKGGSGSMLATPAGRNGPSISTGTRRRPAGHRRRPRRGLLQAPASHAAQGPPHRPIRPAWATSADELRTAPLDHADPRGLEARSREGPHHAWVDLDHLRGLAGCEDEHRADHVGSGKRHLRVPRDLPPAWRAATPDRILAKGAGQTPPRCSATTTRGTGQNGAS
jgi:hypothetical protein